ncbi:DUF2637 domain-containing protein [Streptomyces sp. NBC_01142]|uniref:DUF2637 domain-containing protein n=1 Tax=Streptomyces sp. NBC_01142 TaxID=2975865 RepID=UPI00225B3C48|nr:DUF2637 domain-containing protein [Streptomyces sp. NBC_01142]MCX4824393.1 DUF2637 domain-containing protein [Streptomyces sp. NBC_01142]
MSTTTPPIAAPPPLSKTERTLLGTVIPAGTGVGGLGLAASFNSVSEAANRWGFTYPWMLPVGIDLAIPVFTAANLLLIRLGMPLAWVRFVPWGLTLVTCWLNIAAGSSVSAKVAHGAMPLLWVVLSEIAAHIYAVRIGAATGARMERIRRSRWLIAPRTTLLLWRRMVLWETTDYREALALEKQRLLVRAELCESYGRGWRRKAPRRDLVLLKLGELTPDGFSPTDEEEEPDAESGSGSAPRQRRKVRPEKKSRRMTWGEAISKAREETAGWPYERLDAEPIRRVVGCSQDRSRQLRDVLRAERLTETAKAEPIEATV